MKVKVKVSLLERRYLNKNRACLMSFSVVSLRCRNGCTIDALGFQHHIGKGMYGTLSH